VVLNFGFICIYWSDYMLMQLVFCKFWSLLCKLMKNVLNLLIVKVFGRFKPAHEELLYSTS